MPSIEEYYAGIGAFYARPRPEEEQQLEQTRQQFVQAQGNAFDWTRQNLPTPVQYTPPPGQPPSEFGQIAAGEAAAVAAAPATATPTLRDRLNQARGGRGPLDRLGERVGGLARNVAGDVLGTTAQAFTEGIGNIPLITAAPTSSGYQPPGRYTVGDVATQPVPEAEALQEGIEAQVEQVPVIGPGLGLASEVLIPTTPLELALAPTGAGTLGDVTDIARLGRAGFRAAARAGAGTVPTPTGAVPAGEFGGGRPIPGGMERDAAKARRQRNAIGQGGVETAGAIRDESLQELRFVAPPSTEEMDFISEGLQFNRKKIGLPDEQRLRTLAPKAGKGQAAAQGRIDAQLKAHDILSKNPTPSAAWDEMRHEVAMAPGGKDPRQSAYLREMTRIHNRMSSFDPDAPDNMLNMDALEEIGGVTPSTGPARAPVRPAAATLRGATEAPTPPVSRAEPEFAPEITGRTPDVIAQERAFMEREVARLEGNPARSAQNRLGQIRQQIDALDAEMFRTTGAQQDLTSQLEETLTALRQDPSRAQERFSQMGRQTARTLDDAVSEAGQAVPESGLPAATGAGTPPPPQPPTATAGAGGMPPEEPPRPPGLGRERTIDIKGMTKGQQLDFNLPVKPKRDLFKTALDIGTEVTLFAPRALQTTWDYSFPLRQGAMLLASHPQRWAQNFVKGGRALFSEDYMVRRMEEINNRARMGRTPSTLYISPIEGENLPLEKMEEEFMGRFWRILPGFRQATRGSQVFLNGLRSDVAMDFANKMRRLSGRGLEAGRVPTRTADEASEAIERYGDYINRMTGRGNLGEMESSVKALNQVFYSARRMVSQVQAPGYLFNTNRDVRTEAWKDFGAFVAMGAGALALADLAGVADVGLKPDDKNFGVIKIGDTRVDLWAGYRPLVRLFYKAAQGQVEDFGSVDNMWEAVEPFLRAKLSPQAGSVWDIVEGYDFLGNPVDLSTTEGALDYLKEKYVALSVQGMIDAIQHDGLAGAIAATSGFFGTGVQSYGLNPSEEFEKRAVDELIPELFPNLEASLGRKATPGDLGSGERDALDRLYRERFPGEEENLEEYRRQRGSIFQKAEDEVRTKEQEYVKDLDDLWGAFNRKEIDPEDFKDRLNQIKAEMRGARNAVYDDEAIQKALAGMPENDIRQLEDEWFRITENSMVGGQVDWDLVEKNQNDFKQNIQRQYGPEMLKRFEENLKLRDDPRQLHPALQLQQRATEARDTYRNEVKTQAIPALIKEGVLPRNLQGLEYDQLGSGEVDQVQQWMRVNKGSTTRAYEELRRMTDSPFQKATDEALKQDEENFIPQFQRIFDSIFEGADPQDVKKLMDATKNQRIGARNTIYSDPDYKKALAGLGQTDIRRLEDEWFKIAEQARRGAEVDWELKESLEEQFMNNLRRKDPAMAERFQKNIEMRDQTADIHPLLQLYDEVNEAAEEYFDMPDEPEFAEQKEDWLRSNPGVNAALWLTYGTGLQTVTAMQEAMRYGVQGREGGMRLSGTRQEVDNKSIRTFQQYGQQIDQLLTMETKGPDGQNLRTELRKSSIFWDALYAWLGLSSPEKDKENSIAVYHNPQEVLDFAKQYFGSWRTDNANVRASSSGQSGGFYQPFGRRGGGINYRSALRG